jgi:hypothetical protein
MHGTTRTTVKSFYRRKRMYGYAGNILRVDLSEGLFRRIPFSDDFARKFIGGN